jgi:hypothetical protein
MQKCDVVGEPCGRLRRPGTHFGVKANPLELTSITKRLSARTSWTGEHCCRLSQRLHRRPCARFAGVKRTGLLRLGFCLACHPTIVTHSVKTPDGRLTL